ncbi:alpha/beta hydrolase [Maribacter sp. 1_2014MBL_MicDiv]|uniref:alpha/beta hydrolase n=1 Tax=Maribacter sp. 1_2014MBL_MicDiv TaxID=1644130 RepID=UPI0008F4BE68|nr:alpha/beta hydrolase family protein [Maribacter sp. 1_2014MBL_MicDiv]APA63233.1 XynC protein [Maribacter sp. 1_2014MBL_MicDiv]
MGNKKYFLLALLFHMALMVTASSVDTLIVHSKAMNKDIKNVVITPNGYGKKNTPYKVVYLLHGAGGDYKAWLKVAPKLTAYADQYNIIIVCPDGDVKSWYLDSPIDPTFKYETYVSKELVAEIDDKYNTVKNANARAITGYSMGGHGALYLAFKHYDVWGVAASMSGGVDIRPYALKWGIPDRLGSFAENPEYWENNSVINLVHLISDKKLVFQVDCGTEDFFYEDNKRLHEKLMERKIPHEYIERPGKHNPDYWRNSIKYQLLFFNEFFNNHTTDQ